MKIKLFLFQFQISVSDIIDIQRNTDQSTSIQNDSCYHNNQKYLKVKDFLNIRFLDLMIFKRLKLLKELAKYQANIHIGTTLRT